MQAATVPVMAAPAGSWMMCQDPNGRQCWYNTTTGQMTYDVLSDGVTGGVLGFDSSGQALMQPQPSQVMMAPVATTAAGVFGWPAPAGTPAAATLAPSPGSFVYAASPGGAIMTPGGVMMMPAASPYATVDPTAAQQMVYVQQQQPVQPLQALQALQPVPQGMIAAVPPPSPFPLAETPQLHPHHVSDGIPYGNSSTKRMAAAMAAAAGAKLGLDSANDGEFPRVVPNPNGPEILSVLGPRAPRMPYARSHKARGNVPLPFDVHSVWPSWLGGAAGVATAAEVADDDDDKGATGKIAEFLTGKKMNKKNKKEEEGGGESGGDKEKSKDSEKKEEGKEDEDGKGDKGDDGHDDDDVPTASPTTPSPPPAEGPPPSPAVVKDESSAAAADDDDDDGDDGGEVEKEVLAASAAAAATAASIAAAANGSSWAPYPAPGVLGQQGSGLGPGFGSANVGEGGDDGPWVHYYDREGEKWWRNTITGERRNIDPYR